MCFERWANVSYSCQQYSDVGWYETTCYRYQAEYLLRTAVNGIELGREKYMHNQNSKAGSILHEMYRSTPHKVVNGANTILVNYHYADCGQERNPTPADHALNIWLTSEVSICPDGFALNPQDRCVQSAKDISTLDCGQPSYCSEFNNAIVCGDGERFNAVSSQKQYSTVGGKYTTKRTYQCNSAKEEFDYSELERDRAAITVTKSGDEYNVNYAGGKIGLGGLEKFDCAPMCKVMNPKSGTQITPDGTVVTTKEGEEYRLCVENACPISEGETLVQDCKCDDTSDFGEAVSILGVLEEMENAICVGQ
jgi:hypothetical protein